MYAPLPKKQLELLIDEIIRNIDCFCIKGKKKKIFNPIRIPFINDFYEEISVISCNPLIDLLYSLWFAMPFCSYYSVYTWIKKYTYSLNDSPTYVPQSLKDKLCTLWQMPKRKYIWTYSHTIYWMIVFWNFINFLEIYRESIQEKIKSFAQEKSMIIDKSNKIDQDFIDFYIETIDNTIKKLI